MAKKTFIWPEWMGYPTVDGYGVQVVDRRVGTDMEVGHRLRVEFDTDESIVNCSLLCDRLQAAFFEGFERAVLAQGTRPIKIKLWIGGRLKEQVATFKERPQLTAKHGSYTSYSFVLMLEKRLGLPSSVILWILYVFGAAFFHWFVNRLHYILHVEAPKVTNTPDNIWTATDQEWEDAK